MCLRSRSPMMTAIDYKTDVQYKQRFISPNSLAHNISEQRLPINEVFYDV